MANNKKPFGITLIVLYSALTALLLIPAGCTSSLLGGLPQQGSLFAFMGFAFTLIGLLSLAVVYGLWTLQKWGRSLAFWLYLVSIPLGVLATFIPMDGYMRTPGNVITQIIGIAIDLVVISYLTRRDVKALFDEEETSSFSSWANRR